MKIKLLTFFTVLAIGCSSHVERKNQSLENYYIQINNELANKNVIAHLLDNSNMEGKFIHLDNNYISLANVTDTLEIITSKVNSILYKKNKPSWFLATLTGFALGGMVYAISGARFDLAGGGGKYPEMISVIPAFTLIGAISTTASTDYYKTYVLQK